MVILTNIITFIAGLFIFQNEFDFAVLIITYSFGLYEKKKQILRSILNIMSYMSRFKGPNLVGII